MSHVQRSGLNSSVGSTIFTVSVALCCCPCMCIVGSLALIAGGCVKIARWESPRTKKKKAKREIKRQIPRVLEPRLERHLTIGKTESLEEIDKEILVSSKKVSKPPARTEQQTQSLFFGLPLEVRRQIYAEAIGGYVIHTSYVHIYKRFNHTRCKIESCDHNYCRLQTKQPGAQDESGAVDLMALLKSCRRIYSEAIETLYFANVFEFEDLNNVLLFSLTILPERFRSMRQVEWMISPESEGIAEKTTPWLICSLPNDCCCISCLPDQVYTNIRSHDWVTYMWQMRLLEQNLAIEQVEVEQ